MKEPDEAWFDHDPTWTVRDLLDSVATHGWMMDAPDGADYHDMLDAAVEKLGNIIARRLGINHD